VGLNGTAKDRADLDVVLVVLAELHNAGVSAVMRVQKRMASDSKEISYKHTYNPRKFCNMRMKAALSIVKAATIGTKT